MQLKKGWGNNYITIITQPLIFCPNINNSFLVHNYLSDRNRLLYRHTNCPLGNFRPTTLDKFEQYSTTAPRHLPPNSSRLLDIITRRSNQMKHQNMSENRPQYCPTLHFPSIGLTFFTNIYILDQSLVAPDTTVLYMRLLRQFVNIWKRTNYCI